MSLGNVSAKQQLSNRTFYSLMLNFIAKKLLVYYLSC